jgi:seryl-tRNA synthetase
MLDLKFIRENPDAVRINIINKNESADINAVLSVDEKRRNIIQEVEQLKNQRNTVTSEIAVLKKNKEDATEKIEAMKLVSDRIKELDDELREADESLRDQVSRIPNMVHSSVPVGKTAEDNVEVRRWGTNKMVQTKNHIEISKALGIIDFERGTKVSGSGFAYYVGQGAALERALINFMLEKQTTENGYTELMTPLIVNPGAMFGTGQLPKMVDDMYFAEKDNLYLIPTAEVPITNFYAGEMLKVEDLPIKFCGYTPCFRREAGSYGKETRGFLRVHQFNKVELVKFALPETSYDELESLTGNAESILKALEIPYRVIQLCSGDTSFSSAKTYDIEVWSPGEQKWLEASSCSNFEDFQARRANIRFKRTPTDKPEFVHTLNGSGMATSRLIVALIENYYQEDGRIKVPEVLRPYTKFDYIG